MTMDAINTSGRRGGSGKKLPGPRPVPLIGARGNVFQAAQDLIGYGDRLFAQYGSPVALAAGGNPKFISANPNCPGTILTVGPEAMGQIATQPEAYEKIPLTFSIGTPEEQLTPRTEPLTRFGAGLFGLKGEEHRRYRRMLMPLFSKQHVKSYRDDMVAITEATIAAWRVGDTLDIARAMQDLNQAIVSKTLIGAEKGEEEGALGAELYRALSMVTSPFTILFPYDLPGTSYHRFLNLVARLDQLLRRVIERKRKSLAHGAPATDVLSILIQMRDEESGATFSEEDLIAHTNAIFIGGYEVVWSALSWTLFLLSQYPTVVADLHDQLTSVLHGDAPTVEQLEQLPLLEGVVKESLRLLPPAPWKLVTVAHPTHLSDYALAAGTEICHSIYHTHRIAEFYPDPLTFQPQRWASIRPSVYEYAPFGAGARLCIGSSFAMLELQIVLAILVQRYHLQLAPGVKVDRYGTINLLPKHAMPMIVRPQEQQFRQPVGAVRGNIRTMVNLPAS